MSSAENHITLMSRLKTLRDRDILTDIILRTETDEFKAHKIILSCSSEYFYALFTDPMIESKANNVHLSMITSEGLKIILDYIYTLELDVNNDNILDVLHAASYLQIEAAITICDLYLRSNINDENVIDIINVAETYSLVDLHYSAHLYLAANLNQILKSDDIYKLSAIQIEFFLTNDFVTKCSEAKILQFVVKWFITGSDAGVAQKLMKCEQILSKIVFENITTDQLDKIISELLLNEGFNKDHVLYKLLLEKKLLLKSVTWDYSLGDPENVRGMKKAFILVGGIGTSGITNTIKYKFVDENKWYQLTSIPHENRYNCGVAVYKNVLYVCGGLYYDDCESEVLNSYACSYDPSINKWKTLEPMIDPRCEFTLTVLRNSLYVVGGGNNISDSNYYSCNIPCASCYKYKIATDKWSLLTPLPIAICEHAACTLHFDGCEHLLVSGGIGKTIISSQVFAYNSKKDQWFPLKDLIAARAEHYMFRYKDDVYVCGGWNVSSTNRRSYVNTIDKYDPIKNNWETITKRSKVVEHTAVVMNDSKIYFIGGFNYDSDMNQIFKGVEYYDIDTNCWHVVTDTPPNLWEQSCVMMYLPKNKVL